MDNPVNKNSKNQDVKLSIVLLKSIVIMISGIICGIYLYLILEVSGTIFLGINPKIWGRHYCIVNSKITPYVRFPEKDLNRINPYYPLYAVTYSEKRFKKVKPGMNEGEVLHLLGEPVKIEEYAGGIEIWIYVDFSGRGDMFLRRSVHMEEGLVTKKSRYTNRVPWMEM